MVSGVGWSVIIPRAWSNDPLIRTADCSDGGSHQVRVTRGVTPCPRGGGGWSILEKRVREAGGGGGVHPQGHHPV